MSIIGRDGRRSSPAAPTESSSGVNESLRSPRRQRLAALDERGRGVGVGSLGERIVSNPAREAEALRLDRLRGRPRAQPARFRANRQRLAPRHRATMRTPPRLRRRARSQTDHAITSLEASLSHWLQRSLKLRLKRRSRPARPSPRNSSGSFSPAAIAPAWPSPDIRFHACSIIGSSGLGSASDSGPPPERPYRAPTIAPTAPVMLPPSAPGRGRRECRRYARCRSTAGHNRPSRRSLAAPAGVSCEWVVVAGWMASERASPILAT